MSSQSIDGCEVRCTFLGKPITVRLQLHEVLGLEPSAIEFLEEETLMGLVREHVLDQRPQGLEFWPLVNGAHPKKEESGGS